MPNTGLTVDVPVTGAAYFILKKQGPVKKINRQIKYGLRTRFFSYITIQNGFNNQINDLHYLLSVGRSQSQYLSLDEAG